MILSQFCSRLLGSLVLFLPLLVWAGEPPPTDMDKSSVAAPYGGAVQQLAPRVVMKSLPEQDMALLPKLTERVRNRMRQAGFILNRPPAKNYLIGSLDRKNIMGKYDLVLLHTTPLPPEAPLIVHRPGPILIDPLTQEKMGVLSFYIGRLKTQYSAPTGTVAEVTDSYRALTAGDSLLNESDIEQKFKIHQTAVADMEGRILRVENNLEFAGSDQLFAVGLGRRDQATLGLMLPIYQITTKIPDPVTKKPVALPPRLIGHGVLIRIGERASIAFLVDSARPIKRGDRMTTSP
jgi:hypothetical protein